jgi:hypothetical protein
VESLEQLREIEARWRARSVRAGGDLESQGQREWEFREDDVDESATLPAQDAVDEIAEALGVPQARDAEIRISAEILKDRDRHYWDLEWKAARARPSP